MRNAALITGASRGLGQSLALRFGRGGWAVAVNYLTSKERAESTVNEIIDAGGDALAFQADVRDFGQVDAMVSAALARWGRIDVLINNAGIARPGLTTKLNNLDWQEVIDTNLKGCFNTIKAVSRPMMKARSGHIINVSSIVGIRGKAGQAAYGASKAGILGLTKAAAVEFSSRGVQVNAVLPGYMLTDMGEGASDRAKDEALKDNLLKRYSDPDEVADFIYHLAGMKSVSGQVFNLDSRII